MNFSQKRFYAGPVHLGNERENDISPPKAFKSYTKDLSNYNDLASRNQAYLLVGTLGFVGAMAAKNIVTDFIATLSASADLLALSKVEVCFLFFH